MWNRNASLDASKPESPPSPKIVCGHVVVEPCVSNVPLSCVPPWMFFELRGFTERLWNCSVWRPLFRLVYVLGTADSSCWQRVSSEPTSPRPEHRLEALASVPLDSIRPPSEPSQYCSGLFGFVISAC